MLTSMDEIDRAGAAFVFWPTIAPVDEPPRTGGCWPDAPPAWKKISGYPDDMDNPIGLTPIR